MLNREESSKHQRIEITSLVTQPTPRKTSLLLLWRRAWTERRVCMLCHMQWVSSLRGSNASFTALINKANLSVSLVRQEKYSKY